MKYINNTVDIILPVYQEQENIELVVKKITRNVRQKYNIILVFQDPGDPTISIIRKIQKKNKRVKLVKSKYGMGILAALRTGFEYGKSSIIVTMMADLSDDPKDLDKMVERVRNGYDLVCASRYSRRGKRSGGPVLKGFLSFIACKSLRFLTGLPTNDATNAYKSFKKEVLNNITIESEKGFEFPLELTVKAYFLGMKISEIPTVWHERKNGKSKFVFLDVLPKYLRWYFFALRTRFIPFL